MHGKSYSFCTLLHFLFIFLIMDDFVWTVNIPAYSETITFSSPDAPLTSLPKETRIQVAMIYRVVTTLSPISHFKRSDLFEQCCAAVGVAPESIPTTFPEDPTSLFPIGLDLEARHRIVTTLIVTALASKTYDARDRVCARGVARLLAVPWPSVAATESLLMESLLAASASPTERSGESQRKTRIAKRVAMVAGVGVIGGAVLFFTGGLAAPIVLPAVQAVGTGTAMVASSVGLTAAATGIALSTTALLTYLTVPVLATMIGVGGAGLCGYRAARRTAGCTDFEFRKISEVDYPDPVEFVGPENDDALHVLGQDNETDAPHGPVVAIPSRSVTVKNILDSITASDRKMACGFDNRTKYTLEIVHQYVQYGCWSFQPPLKISPNSSAAYAGRNKSLRPTGTSFAVVYRISGFCDIVLCAGNPLVGNSVAMAVVQSPKAVGEYTQEELERYISVMHSNAHANKFTAESSSDTLLLSWTVQDCEVCFLLSVMADTSSDAAVVAIGEGMQRACDHRKQVVGRRRLAFLSLGNSTSAPLRFVSWKNISGRNIIMNTQGVPTFVLGPQQAVVVGSHNLPMTPGGAGCYLIYESEEYVVAVKVEESAGGTLTASGCVAPIGTPESKLIYPASGSAHSMSLGDGFNVVVTWTISNGVAAFRVCEIISDTTHGITNAMHVAIGISGFTTILDAQFPRSEQCGAYWYPHLRSPNRLGIELAEGYYLQWETSEQLAFGDLLTRTMSQAVKDNVVGKVKEKTAEQVGQHVLSAALCATMFAVYAASKIPAIINWSSSAIDNSFVVLQNRAVYAGEELAAALLAGAHGSRPVTLIGVSCGTGVVLSCLRVLHEKCKYHVVENVFLLGCTVPLSQTEWTNIRHVVSGRVVNVFSRRDWFLRFLFRTNHATLRPVPGLSCVRGIPGIENVDCSAVVPSHIYYALRLKEILALVPVTPTAESLDPEGISPGVCFPLGVNLRSNLKQFHDTMEESNKMTVCIKNKTKSNLEFVASWLSEEIDHLKWDFCPPESIPAAQGGTCGYVSKTSASSMNGKTHVTVAYSCEQFTLFVRTFSDLSGQPVIMATLESPESIPPQSTTVPPEMNETHIKLKKPSGEIYLVKARVNPKTMIARVTVSIVDDVFRSQLKTLADVRSWPELHTNSFEPLTSVAKLESVVTDLRLKDLRFVVTVARSETRRGDPFTIRGVRLKQGECMVSPELPSELLQGIAQIYAFGINTLEDAQVEGSIDIEGSFGTAIIMFRQRGDVVQGQVVVLRKHTKDELELYGLSDDGNSVLYSGERVDDASDHGVDVVTDQKLIRGQRGIDLNCLPNRLSLVFV
eukprot:PhF_6_TR26244/c0_g1_i1/m.37522